VAFDFSGLNADSLSTFGESVIYQRAAGGSPFSVVGIRVDPRTQEGTSPGVNVLLWVKLSDFASPPIAGDEVTIGSVHYVVVGEPAADAGGGEHLSLVQS